MTPADHVESPLSPLLLPFFLPHQTLLYILSSVPSVFQRFLRNWSIRTGVVAVISRFLSKFSNCILSDQTIQMKFLVSIRETYDNYFLKLSYSVKKFTSKNRSMVGVEFLVEFRYLYDSLFAHPFPSFLISLVETERCSFKNFCAIQGKFERVGMFSSTGVIEITPFTLLSRYKYVPLKTRIPPRYYLAKFLHEI